MNAKSLLPGLLGCLLSSAAVAAPPETTCTVKIERAWVRAAPPSAKVLAAYATVRNPCRTTLTVVGVESRDFAGAMIHRTVVEGGVSRMRAADRLDIPAGGELRFEPGGLHLMLMRPLRKLPEHDRVGIRLLMQDGRRAFAEYEVRKEAPAR